MAPVAKEFDKIIKDGRERKKNEELANAIFSKNRRQSAPSKLKAPLPGGSLASRVGVKKRAPATAVDNRRSSLPAGNVNGDWIHDLHHTVNRDAGKGSLSSRITLPGAKKGPKVQTQKAAKLAAALDRMDVDAETQQQVNLIKPNSGRGPGLTIRGLAGPFSVMAQNFAPGTSAADIESAMTPIGGEMITCKIIKTHPIILVEMEFASREGGERVIETFNNKTADGRVIKVYPKIGGTQHSSVSERIQAPSNAPSGPRGNRGNNTKNDKVIGGSTGFSDLIQKSHPNDSNGRLYSDKLVTGSQRGRGFRGGRGRH